MRPVHCSGGHIMVEVNEKLTLQVAELARLELSNSEVSTFTPQLREILKYVEKLQEVNVQNVEPLTHPIELATAFREDTVEPSPVDSEGCPKVLSSAPEVLGGGF